MHFTKTFGMKLNANFTRTLGLFPPDPEFDLFNVFLTLQPVDKAVNA